MLWWLLYAMLTPVVLIVLIFSAALVYGIARGLWQGLTRPITLTDHEKWDVLNQVAEATGLPAPPPPPFRFRVVRQEDQE